MTPLARFAPALAFVSGLCAGCGGGPSPAAAPPDSAWTDSFALEKCTHLTTGRNRFFILEPGYQLVLADKADQVVVTVLDDTVQVNGIETRVLEEREFAGGKLKEVSRNFFTICREHGDVFYHGEDVDDYKDGKVVGHGGAWRAGVNGARAGLMMPAKASVGLRHYQEVAPGVAMDRAEVESDAVTFESPAGEFTGCLRVVETTPLESGRSVKIYAPGVGLVFDDGLVLVARGEGKKPPAGPVAVPAGSGTFLAEVEIPEKEMPAPVAAAVKKAHPDGTIKEIKRESHAGGKTVYAIELRVGDAQYDVEVAPDGKVLLDKKE
jgi:hypothetical protein